MTGGRRRRMTEKAGDDAPVDATASARDDWPRVTPENVGEAMAGVMAGIAGDSVRGEVREIIGEIVGEIATRKAGLIARVIAWPIAREKVRAIMRGYVVEIAPAVEWEAAWGNLPGIESEVVGGTTPEMAGRIVFQHLRDFLCRFGRS
jgi:hypothetical protein